jgi:endonuclease YncB( thermonuclease family)
MGKIVRHKRQQRKNPKVQGGHQRTSISPRLLLLGLALGAIAGYLVFELTENPLGTLTNISQQVAADNSKPIAGRASVIDGDTLEIHGIRIRLHGIDAPESGQFCSVGGKKTRCGQQAALALADRIGTSNVSCDPRDRDRYNRVVAVCFAGDEDLNAWMVSVGWAMAYRYYSTAYVPQEDKASASKLGIWQGDFVPPWDWRRGTRLAGNVVEQPPKDCLIKGNISMNTGERIYHVPGGYYYDRTKITTSKGERWFCTEAQARAAGWRRSKR